MSGADQGQGVQQQIADVVRKVSDFEAALSTAKQAGDEDEVSFLRGRLLQLGEEKNLLLKAQQGGGCCSLFHHLHFKVPFWHGNNCSQMRIWCEAQLLRLYLALFPVRDMQILNP